MTLRNTYLMTGSALAVALAMVATVGAQPPGPPGPPRDRGPDRPRFAPEDRPPVPPVFAALDTDRDGNLSEEEIDNAAAVLGRLLDENDTDGDGLLSLAELRPRRGLAGAPGGRGERLGRPQDQGGRRGRNRRGAPLEGAPPEGPPPPERQARPAERGPGPRANAATFVDRMMQRDADGDGQLVKDELPPRMQQRFDVIDTNSDGSVDRAELTAGFERMRERARGGGRQRPPLERDDE